jgi:hypothetical protein
VPRRGQEDMIIDIALTTMAARDADVS